MQHDPDKKVPLTTLATALGDTTWLFPDGKLLVQEYDWNEQHARLLSDWMQ